jgi:redox-sensitive bicupin YhaK (pirin superfamily)
MNELLLEARPRDLGGFTVGRVLPAIARRTVGPFVFFDHMGPAQFAPGKGMDVRPHPHIGLATVTYLFEGQIHHRDTLGSSQTIEPGGINWMTAGRGIAHSERTPPAQRSSGGKAHGLQLWVALPVSHEETAPAFDHHPAASLPGFDDGGVKVRVLAGSAYGATSPVRTLSPLFFVEASLAAGAVMPLPSEHEERAVYVVEGEAGVWAGDVRVPARQMIVLPPGPAPTLHSDGPARVALIGGAPLDGPRHVWWNFVSSSHDRIEQAKADWTAGRFGKIPGDDVESIPLP